MIADLAGMPDRAPERAKSLRQVDTVAAVEGGRAVVDMNLSAIAVELGLVEPFRAGRQPGRHGRQHWGDERVFAQHSG